MTMPEQLSQAARWLLVVGLAFFSAEAASALLQRYLQVPAKPFPLSTAVPIQNQALAQAAPPGLVSLLKTTEPEGTTATSPEASATPSVQARPSAPPANLQLRGTMASGGGAGLAMIDVNGTTQVVNTGDTVGGMTLASVESYSVTLQNSEGKIQILEMSSETVASTSAPPPTAVAQPIANPMPTPDPNAQATPDLANAEPAPGAIMTQKELRDILNNPEQFAGKGFRMKPVLNGQEIIGMQVAMQNPSHPLARLGIKDGDVIRSLNGTALNGPEALSNVYRVLRNTSSLSFDVQRGGADQKIEITLEE